jgi:GT2 family glycosyltransferase
MNVAVAVITWNGSQYIGACLESLVTQTLGPDILVLDNASTDDTVDIVRSFTSRMAPESHTLRVIAQSANEGYTIGANAAMRTLLSSGTPYDVITLLNQDVTLAPEWLASVRDLLVRSTDVGAVGSKMFYPDGVTLQHAGGYVTQPRLVGQHYGQHEVDDAVRYDVEREVDFVTGAAIALRVVCLAQVGLFDEIFAPGYYDDVDLCVRIHRAGWRVIYCPRAQAYHVESASFRDRFERLLLSHRNRLIFAVEHLADAHFAARFFEAERAALETEPLDVLRALGLAYLQVMIRLEQIARARLPSRRWRRSVIEAIAHVLARLRESCLTEVRRRRTSGLERRSS